MDENEYLEFLDKAYSELPEVLYKKGRFEIPVVRGKLIKSRTVINNFKEIAKLFVRDEEHLLKYFLREAGVRGNITSRGELILFSRFQPNNLNKIVESYYYAYVECPFCRSPDTVLIEDHKLLKCNACGHQQGISKL